MALSAPSRPIFDPFGDTVHIGNAPRPRTTFAGTRSAAVTAAEWDSLRRDVEDDKSFRDMRRMMHQTHGVCG